GEGAVLAAGEADVRGDGIAGAGDGDVGEQQPGDALALAHRGGGVVPDAGQVGDQLGDPVFLSRRERAGVLLAGFVVGGLSVAQGAQGGVPVGVGGPLPELGGDLQGSFDGQRGEGGEEQLADVLVQGAAGDDGAERAGVL